MMSFADQELSPQKRETVPDLCFWRMENMSHDSTV